MFNFLRRNSTTSQRQSSVAPSNISEKEYNKIKTLTKEELIKFYNIEVDDEDDWYKGVYEYGKELYNFGKYTNFNPPKGCMKSFFKKKCLKEKYEEYV